MSSTLKLGDKAPTVSLPNQAGTIVDLSSIVSSHAATVIFFYPQDNTPVCTKEACFFRDNYQAFKDLDVAVLGISSDDQTSHSKFAKEHNLNFDILSDTNQMARKAFGVDGAFVGKLVPPRVTFVLDREGVVHLIYSSRFTAEDHVQNALTVVKKLLGKDEVAPKTDM